MVGSSLEISRDTVKIKNNLAGISKEATLENEIEFPCRASKVSCVFAEIENVICEAGTGKVTCRGTLYKRVKWLTDVGGQGYRPGESNEENLRDYFSETFEVPEIMPGMEIIPKVLITGVESIPSGKNNDQTVWFQKTGLKFLLQVIEDQEVEILTDILTPTDVEVHKEVLTIRRAVGEGENQETLTSEVEFKFAATEITRLNAWIKNVRAECQHDHVEVLGSVYWEVEYRTEEDNTLYVEKEEDFQIRIDVPEIEKGMEARAQAETVATHYNFTDQQLEVHQEAHLECELKVSVYVSQILSISVVTNVQGEGLEVDYQRLYTEQVVTQIDDRQEITHERLLKIPANEIIEVQESLAINHAKTSLLDGRVHVEGDFFSEVVYTGFCDGKIYNQALPTIPLSFILEAPGAEEGMSLQLKSSVEEVSYSAPVYPGQVCSMYQNGRFHPKNYPWKETVIVKFQGNVLEMADKRVVKDLREPITKEPVISERLVHGEADLPKKDARPDLSHKAAAPYVSIRYCQVQPGDTLGEIAERYETTVEALRQLNTGIEAGVVGEKTWLRIPLKK